MLISSMDQLNYYSMPKDGYLEIDTSANAYQLGQPSMEEGSPTFMNEENSPKNGTKSSLYKTELCKRFSEFGSCRYGAKCQFAHGLAELRHVVRHPKYKTTKCKSYWGSGHCPYGSRCRFIHEEAESMTPPPFSPPGAMNAMSGMFFREPSNGNGDGLPVSSPVGNGNGNGLFYNANGTGNASGYQKDYSLLGSFSNDAAAGPWGPTPSSQLNHHHHHHAYGDRAMPPPAVIAGPNGVAAINGAAYPDLQDAIDALMRFSLSPAEAEAQARAALSVTANATATGTPVVVTAPLGTISTSPAVARTGVTVDASGAVSVTTKKADYSLDADELWKDFPTLSASSHGDFGTDKQWPAGLSLSLEGTGLFSSTNTSTTATVGTPPTSSSTSAAGAGVSSTSAASPAKTPAMETTTTTAGAESPQPPATSESSPGKKDETSPRLSVFERFH